jgi:hypothetical protein
LFCDIKLTACPEGFENRVLRRIFGHKGDEVRGEWRKFHSGVFYNLYSFANIIRQITSRRMLCAGHGEHIGEKRKLYKLLVVKHEGKSSFGSPGHTWVNAIEIDLREIGWDGVE